MRLNYTRLPIVLAILALLAALLSSAGYTPTQAQTHPNGSGGGVGQGMPHTSTIGTAALFPDSSEGFESSWPASGWALRDLSSNDGGEYFWGKRNCHPHTGSYAIWSAGGGAQGSQLGCLSSIYPNNMSTQALYGPFNLSDVLSATLTYNIYGSTEWDGTNNCPYDRFTMRAYTDSGVYSYSYFCGNWTNGTYGNGYYLRVLDLNGLIGPGKGNVWLSLEFTSDISNGDIGMLVDDIMLYAVRPPPTATPTPSITPTRTPTLTPTITPTFIPGTTPTATATDTPTPTNTPTPPPTNTIGPLTPQPIYLPLTLGAPLPTPLLQPAKACVDDDEPNNIPEDGKRLTTINDSCVGSFQNERTPIFDYYWIEPIKGQHIVVDLTGIPAGANYDVALYRQDPGNKYPQEALSNKPGQAPEHFEYTFDRNQRYYLRVSLLQKASGAKDTYILKVAIN